MAPRNVRPGSVTFVVVLTWIYAILMMINGGLWLFAMGEDGFLSEVDATANTVEIYAWSILIIGVFIALLAIGLGNGSRFARFLINAVMVIRIGLDVWGLISIPGYPLWQAVISIAWAALILALLNHRSASQWFLDT
ncbi:hypothetical protein [Demequina flava]|uniref:hypothetical protein n=1 Tax=Demequina flava TaxID=1095025 RepID=UPI00078419D3|nr:hypothetical protein [Demequina flava]